jgi:hypothetical protein
MLRVIKHWEGLYEPLNKEGSRRQRYINFAYININFFPIVVYVDYNSLYVVINSNIIVILWVLNRWNELEVRV